MNGFKPLLPLNGVSALETTIRLFHAAGVGEVLVVLGHRAEELRPLVESARAIPVVNPHFDQGMFTSVRAGAAALPVGVEACFVLPVDTPLVRSQTVRHMAETLDQGEHGILYPVFAGRRGHPPLISTEILRESLRSPGPLSALLWAHEEQARDIAVVDEAIHLDMDTTEDYQHLSALALTRDIPSSAECEAILAILSAPQELREHCRRVAATALRLGTALRERGVPVDLALINAGALLHDIAKGRPNHAEAGEAWLNAMGFPRAGAIVACHMELDVSARQLDEAAIVFLADKLTRGATYVSLEQRFERALERFRDHPEALAAARRRLATAQGVAAAMEARLGEPLAALLGDSNH